MSRRRVGCAVIRDMRVSAAHVQIVLSRLVLYLLLLGLHSSHELMYSIVFFFFFQAEDGIRDIGVTGVQTCALPICFNNFVRLMLKAKQIAALSINRTKLLKQTPRVWLSALDCLTAAHWHKQMRCQIGRASCRERV